MSAVDNFVGAFAGGRSTADALALAVVWFTFAISFYVFSEPAPYDALMVGLVLLLPLLRLTEFTVALIVFMLLWLVVLVGGALSIPNAVVLDRAIQHAEVTLYLALSGTVLAAFIVRRPEEHAQVIMSGYTVAALIATTAAIIGYFDLMPAFHDILTERGRARATFKDPNVFGPFLVPIILWMAHRTLNAKPGQLLLLGTILAYLSFGILLSFSRGAWFNAVVSFAVYGLVSFIVIRSVRHRMKLLLLAGLGLVAVAVIIVIAVNWSATADLLQERASLQQSYDIGPEGRFAGHRKAIGVILEHPLGIGPLGFALRFHHENAHNVYLTAFLEYGWIGGFAFLAVVGQTLLTGFRNCFRSNAMQGLAIVAFAAFVGMSVEGLVVDTYHWRHFFVVIVLIWGIAGANRRPLPAFR